MQVTYIMSSFLKSMSLIKFPIRWYSNILNWWKISTMLNKCIIQWFSIDVTTKSRPGAHDFYNFMKVWSKVCYQLKIFMRQGFILRSDIPLPNPDPHPIQIRVVDTMASSDNPSFRYQGPSTWDPLAEEALFDDSHHPGVTSKGCVLTSNYSVTACVDLATF